MKKRILFLATFVVAVAVTVGAFCMKNTAKADSANDTRELINYKISIPSDYYNGKKTSEMILHYGVNGWKDTKDVTMYVTTGDYSHGIPGSYIYNAVIKVYKGDTINYCFKRISTAGTTSWNNNNGKDFSVVANESNVKTIDYEVNWSYENNNINANNDVTLHYGINGWDNPADVKMELKNNYQYDGKNYTWYKAIISVEEGSTINYCVKANTAEGEVWDNNNGANYSVVANQPYNQ